MMGNDELRPTTEPTTTRIGRRGLLVSAITAGIGAMIAIDVAGSSRDPGPAAPLTDDEKLRHLLRRAGFGAGPAELASYRALGLNGAVDRLVNFEQIDNGDLAGRLQGLNLD